MGNREEKKEKYNGAMLVGCIREKRPVPMRLEKQQYLLGSTVDAEIAGVHIICGDTDNGFWAAGIPNMPSTGQIIVSSALLTQVSCSIQRKEDGWKLVVEKGAELFWYNGKQLKFPEEGMLVLSLNHEDVIRIDRPEEGNSHEQAVVFIFHGHYAENIEWRTIGLQDGKVKMHISRHAELTEGRDEVSENLAELPGHYATLFKEGGFWYVEDHSTRFGVYVNHIKVEGRRKLTALDMINIGHALFLYQHDTIFYNHMETSEKCLVIHIEERSVWNLFRKKVLLQDIDLTINPGEMVLVLGGSGAGKTTFINAVMGYEKAQGKIMEGDIDIYENYNQMKYEIGFVPQQDLLRLEDTVYGTLENAAEMKMPQRTTEETRKARIEEVLSVFGLEREKESLVSKLSGGQRKRLSIAVEFIADPTLFFLDEPDSGLDSVMARDLMENLRGIANQKKMVLVITHSPDRGADLFDKVIVLAKSAEDNIRHLAFYGTVDEAKHFFGTDTLEDVIRRINRPDEGGEGLAAVFGGSMFELKESTRTSFFAIISSCIWIGIFNSIQIVCRERQIIKREHRTGLHITSYVAAHMICQAAICFIQALLMVFIYGIFTNFPKEGLVSGNFYIDLFVTFFLVVYSSDILGLAISSVVRNTTMAMTIMPFILIVQLIFSGSIFPLTGFAKSISNLTISKWGQRVLCIEANLNELPLELLDSELDMIGKMEIFETLETFLPEEVIETAQESVEEALQDFLHDYTYRKIYSYEKDLVLRRWGYLVLFTVLYAAVCVLSLEFIDRDKR